MKTVYIGPFNNDKKGELFSMALEELKKDGGQNFYYLLPNGELLSDYRRKIIREIGKSFEINLFTFDDIVDNILREKFLFSIDDSIKNLIISRIINDLRSERKINYYKDIGKTDGFVEELNYIIGQIKKSLINPKDFLNNCPREMKYTEIGLIYEEYEKKLEELSLTDREGTYFKVIDLLKGDTDVFKDINFIIIDQFYDFRPIEIEILKKLCQSNMDIYINMPFKMSSKIVNIEKTLKMLQGLGFELQYVKSKDKDIFTELSYNFFDDGDRKFKSGEAINLIKAPTIYLELKKVFEFIKVEIKKGTRLDDMGIILLNEQYKHYLFQVSLEEKIPVDMAMEQPLIQIPLIREFLNIIEMKIYNGNKQNFIRRIKSHYFDMVDFETKDGLEYIIRKLGFVNIYDLDLLLSSSKSLNITMEYLESFIGVVDRTIKEMEDIPKEESVADYIEIFSKFIEDYNVMEKVNNRYLVHGDFDLYYRDVAALEKLIEILEKTKSLSLIVDKVTLVEYHSALKELIENESIIKKDRNIEGIKVLNPINGRGINHKILFVTGLSSSHYPNIKENNFLINDVNFMELEQIGIEFKNYQARLNNEAIKFASILSTVKNKLYLSYCQGEEEDSIQSIFLDELLNMIELKSQSPIIVDMGYYFKDKHSITTSDELANYLILNHWKLPKGQVEDYFSYYNANFQDKFKNINEKSICEYSRSSNSFGEYSGVLAGNDIRKDLYKIHENKVYSITYLEAYGRCPYYFLLNKALNVEEMERIFQEYNPVDIGTLYHEVLRQYYTYFKDSIWDYVKGRKEFILGNTVEYLRDITEEKAVQLGFDLREKLNLLIIENVFTKIKNFIEKDLERITKSEEKLLPYGFEVDFGKYGDFEINIHHKKVKFRGTIDRIDKVMGEEKYIIMDYKSSSYGVYDIEQMRQGLSLQLPVYLLSQKDKKIVGGLYGLLSSSKFDMKLGLIDETKHITKRHKGALDEEGLNLLIDDVKERISEMLENILMGNFPVNPQECSPYCIYKDICRYENVLEVE